MNDFITNFNSHATYEWVKTSIKTQIILTTYDTAWNLDFGWLIEWVNTNWHEISLTNFVCHLPHPKSNSKRNIPFGERIKCGKIGRRQETKVADVIVFFIKNQLVQRKVIRSIFSVKYQLFSTQIDCFWWAGSHQWKVFIENCTLESLKLRLPNQPIWIDTDRKRQ